MQILAVSREERNKAIEMANETYRLEQIAARVAARVVNRSRSRIVQAFKTGLYSSNIIVEEMMNVKEELLNLLLAAHLMGIRRSFTNASLQLSRSSQQVDYLRKLLNLNKQELDRLKAEYGQKIDMDLIRTGAMAEGKVNTAIFQALNKNMHNKEAIRHIQTAFDKSGLSVKNSFQIEALFRTQAQLAYNGAKFQANKEGIVGKFLWGYKYVTVGDDRVRPAHKQFEGTTLPKDDPEWDRITPPNGWGCRCQIIEIFRERKIVRPPKAFVDERRRMQEVAPDKGFDFNPANLTSPVKARPQKIEKEKNKLPILQAEYDDLIERLRKLEAQQKELERNLTQAELEAKEFEDKAKREFVAEMHGDYEKPAYFDPHVTVDGKEVLTEYDRLRNEHYRNVELTKEEKEAVNEYVQNGPQLNEYLWQEKLGEAPEYVQKRVELLDSTAAKAPALKEDVIVFRGMGADPYDFSKESKGRFFKPNCFLSTSIDKWVAEEFSRDNMRPDDDGYTLYQIDVPKGTTGIIMPDPTYNEWEEPNKNVEFIFPRKTAYEVLDVIEFEDVDGYQIKKIHLKVLPAGQEEAQPKSLDQQKQLINKRLEELESEMLKTRQKNLVLDDPVWDSRLMFDPEFESKAKKRFETHFTDPHDNDETALGEDVESCYERLASKSYFTLEPNQEEWDSLYEYRGYGYSNINDFCRGREASDAEARRVLKHIRNIDQVLAKAPAVDEDLIIYRGVHSHIHGEKIPKDALLTMPSYTSGSLSKKVAEEFSDKSCQRVLYQIDIPKDAKHILYGMNEGEQEVVLPRNTTFRVVEVKDEIDEDSNEYKRIHLQVAGIDPSYDDLEEELKSKENKQ